MYLIVLKKIVKKFLDLWLANNSQFLPNDFIIYKNDEISKEILVNGFFEHELLFALTNSVFKNIKKRIAIDVGANIGNHTFFLSKHFDKVFSFEPEIQNYQILSANFYKKDSVSTINMGLSDKDEFKYMQQEIQGNKGSLKITNRKSNLKINLTKMDNYFLNSPNIKQIDLIKVDTEGYEYKVFTGASMILDASSPILIFETNPGRQRNLVLRYLRQKGYLYFYEFRYSKIDSGIDSKFLKLIFFLIITIFNKKKIHDLLLIKKFNKSRIYPMVIASKKEL